MPNSSWTPPPPPQNWWPLYRMLHTGKSNPPSMLRPPYQAWRWALACQQCNRVCAYLLRNISRQVANIHNLGGHGASATGAVRSLLLGSMVRTSFECLHVGYAHTQGPGDVHSPYSRGLSTQLLHWQGVPHVQRKTAEASTHARSLHAHPLIHASTVHSQEPR